MRKRMKESGSRLKLASTLCQLMLDVTASLWVALKIINSLARCRRSTKSNPTFE